MGPYTLNLSLAVEGGDKHEVGVRLSADVADQFAKLAKHGVRFVMAKAMMDVTDQLPSRVTAALKQQEHMALIEAHNRGELSLEDLKKAIGLLPEPPKT